MQSARCLDSAHCTEAPTCRGTSALEHTTVRILLVVTVLKGVLKPPNENTPAASSCSTTTKQRIHHVHVRLKVSSAAESSKVP
jgi:hypothetical protein